MQKTDFLEELRQRKMLHNFTPGIEEALATKRVVGYIGFDPTAPSLTIGNYIQIMILSFFQRAGHQPIVLMGGATGRIGDPSFKDTERVLKSNDELEENLNRQMEQFKKLLNFETGENKAILVNNYDFYKDMNALDFLRNVGKTLTVNYMMAKESVKKRIETGISFTEFSYQLLQGFDFQCLFEKYDCVLQMGGSDQWGNITTGTEFVRKNLNKKVFAITTPLLTKSDGTKFGKSEKGNIWMDANLTSPFEFYQFWLRCNDEDLSSFFRYFSYKSVAEIEKLEEEYKDNPNALKKLLAQELTERVHSASDLKNAEIISDILFKKGNSKMLNQLDNEGFLALEKGMDVFELEKSILNDSVAVLELMVNQTKVIDSNGNFRKAIKNNAISVNYNKIGNHEHTVNAEHLVHEKYMILENGKKKKYLLKFL